jgi:hypothetical protein
MGSRVELFEQIRRDRDREGLSTRALAVKYGVHRRAVRQALTSSLPPAKRLPVWRPAPKLGAHHALIDAWLEADRDAGGIEGEVGRFRRRHLVPVPAVGSLDELNAHLRAGCEADLDRQITGQRRTVGEALEAERPPLRALPPERACTQEATPRVDSKAMITVCARTATRCPSSSSGCGCW